MQLAGNVRRGGLIECAFGITLREVLTTYGGGTATAGRSAPCRSAGRSVPTSRLAVRHAARLRGATPSSAPCSAMAASSHRRHRRTWPGWRVIAMQFCAFESCGKCTPCRIGAVRGVEVIDRIVADSDRTQQVELLRELCATMVDGSLCAMGGMTPYPVLSALNHYPEDFGAGVAHAATELKRTPAPDGVEETDYGTPAQPGAATVSLTIDGRAITVPAGTSVLRAALMAGIEIPMLCATDSLEAFGARAGCAWSRSTAARATPPRAQRRSRLTCRYARRARSWRGCAA